MSEAAKKKLSLAKKGKKMPEEFKEKIRLATKGIKKSEATKERMRLAAQKRVVTEEMRETARRNGRKMKGRKLTEEELKKRAASRKEVTPETRMKMSEARKGKKCHLYIHGQSFEPYCEKFNEDFRRRVRAFFGEVCLICKKTKLENDNKSMTVHHVQYNKETCCDDSPPLFVSLCSSHHTKTTHKKNRQEWQDYFTELINTKYNGKCYFTKEEYIEYVKGNLSPPPLTQH